MNELEILNYYQLAFVANAIYCLTFAALIFIRHLLGHAIAQDTLCIPARNANYGCFPQPGRRAVNSNTTVFLAAVLNHSAHPPLIERIGRCRSVVPRVQAGSGSGGRADSNTSPLHEGNVPV